MPAISVPKSCSTNGERSPLPLPMSTKIGILKMENAPYVARSLTGFQYLVSFSSYLPSHGSELIENSTFN